MITWEERYSTGVEELDKQHKNLFKYTNDLEEFINDNALSKETIDRMLHFMDQYIKVHFNHEETCMHKLHCPIASKNQDAHQKFIQKFRATEGKIRNENASNETLRELHHFLETWLVEHICKIDTQLKPCVH